MSAAVCIFCKIIKGEIPSFKLLETDKIFAFLDINPLSRGHALVIPKTHSEKLHDVPDTELAELLPAAKKLALAINAPEYNILQNNGRGAHQLVDHVHVHLIPKPNPKEGLGIEWPAQTSDMGELKVLYEELKAKI